MELAEVPAIPRSLEVVVRLGADEVAVHDDGSSVSDEVGHRLHDIPVGMRNWLDDLGF